MAKLKLTIAIGAYEINRALIEGEVEADGIELNFLTKMGTQEFVSRMLKSREFDVAETGLNYVITAVANGTPGGFTGIPIFPHRRFRHGFVFVNPASAINAPKDLIGQRVGSPYTSSANIWMRGILEEHYAVPYKDVQWVGEQVGMYKLSPSWHQFAPPGVRLQDMLAAGEIAALICPDVPPLVIQKDPRLTYMFPNYMEEEISYYRKTGIFPIMHTMIVKDEVVEKHPWVPTNLIKAFEQSKRIAFQRLKNPRIVPLAFYRAHAEAQEQLLGPDPWPYGLEEGNRKALETFMSYMISQEMIAEPVKLDDCFAPIDLADITADDWH